VQFVSSFRFGFHFGPPLLNYDDIQTCQQLPCKVAKKLGVGSGNGIGPFAPLEDLFGLCRNSFLVVHAPAVLFPQPKNRGRFVAESFFYFLDHLSF